MIEKNEEKEEGVGEGQVVSLMFVRVVEGEVESRIKRDGENNNDGDN